MTKKTVTNETVNHSDTKVRILDSAEQLFAREGFHCTSLRAITTRADVNLASVNYHFGSKEKLLEEVFERRLLPLNRIRTERIKAVLQTAKQAGKRPEVHDIMQAFIEPTLRFRESGPGAQDFISLVGRSFTDPDPTVRNVFLRIITPFFTLLFDALRQALPEISEDTLFWRLQFALGAISHTMNMCGRVCPEETQISFTRDTNSLIEMLVPFVTAGMERR